MTSQRLLAVLLVGVQSTVLWYFTRQQLFPVVMVLAALASTVLKWRMDVDRRSGFWSCIALFFLFSLKYLIAPHQFDSSELFIRTQFAYVLAQYFLTLQVIQFYLLRPQDRLPAAMPALGIVTLVFLGDVRPAAAGLNVFQSLVLVFMLFAAIYGSVSLNYSRPKTGRTTWPRAILLLLIFAAIGSTGWGAATFLRQHERDFDSFIQRYLFLRQPLGRTGFSGKARLGSIAKQKSTASQQIALQVFSKDEPGYLRGKTFDSYQRGRWSQTGNLRNLSPAFKLPPGINSPPNENRTFLSSRRKTTGWRKLDIRPDVTQLPAFFSPLGTTVLQVPLMSVSIDNDGVFYARDLEQGMPFRVAVPETSDVDPLSEEDRNRLTAVPFNLDHRVSVMAKSTLGKLQTDAEKIAAVEAYFAENYQYQMGITVPPDTDPLNYFLLNQPPAHCEYFAAGAAVLLRLADVPCRYVTGFVAVEENSFGNYWIARNRDAHAWVEAYDSERGWVIVEATPAAGVPSGQQTVKAKQLWEYLRDSIKTLMSQLGQGDYRGFSWTILQFVISAPGLVCLVSLVAFLFRRHFRQWRISRSPRREESPLHLELRQLLKKMDARMAKQKLQRGPGETLHHFAQRIADNADSETVSTAAGWYRNYAALRYGGELSQTGVKALATEFEKFRRV